MDYRIVEPDALIATLQSISNMADGEANGEVNNYSLAAMRILAAEARTSATILSERRHSERQFAYDLGEQPRAIRLYGTEVDRCNAVLTATRNSLAQFGQAVTS